MTVRRYIKEGALLRAAFCEELGSDSVSPPFLLLCCFYPLLIAIGCSLSQDLVRKEHCH